MFLSLRFENTNTLLMKKSYLLFFFLFLMGLTSCNPFSSDNSHDANDKKLIETISKNNTRTPSLQFQKQLDSMLIHHPASNTISEKIIKEIFTANIIAEQKTLNAESASLFQKALKESQQLKRKDLETWCAQQYAFYLYTYRKYEESFPYFMLLIKNLESLPDAYVIELPETYKRIAYFLTTNGEQHKAIEYIKKALQYVPENSSQKSALEFSIGSSYFDLGNLDLAQQYQEKSLKTAKAAGDEVRYAKALGSLAEISLKKGRNTEAIALIKQDISLSKKNESHQNTMYAFTVLGHAYLADGKLNDAEKTLKEAEQYAQSQIYYKSNEEEINELILKIAQIKKDDITELKARRNLENIKKTLRDMDGKEVIKKVNWETQKEQLKIMLESEKEKRTKEAYQKKAALGFSVLLFGLIVFIVRSYRNKNKAQKSDYEKKVLQLLLEKTKSENKLIASNRTLNSYRDFLHEKNQQIEALQSEIKKNKNSSSFYLEKSEGELQKLLESHLLTDENWKNFKNAFILQYPKYWQYLKEEFPDLTESNLRIITLKKLQMNNTEISRIAGVTIDAVKKAKQRLRKKYGEKYEELFEIQVD